MAEQSATVWRTSAASNAGNDHVDKVADVIMSVGAHWLWLASVPGKALLECIATGAQLVLHGTTAQIQVGYAPDGGVVDWDTTPSAPVWTGMRNITGNALSMGSQTARLDIAEYEDAILIGIGRAEGWRYAAFAGAVFEPWDESDIAQNIGKDGLLVGIPSRIVSNPNWLFGSTTANLGSCVRTGDIFEPIIVQSASVASPGTTAPDRILSRIGTAERFLPYYLNLLQAGGISQPFGIAKYVRQWRANVPHGTRLMSQTVGSEQAWLGYQYDATQQNQFVLWSKTEGTP